MADFKLTLDPADKIVFSGKLGAEASTVNVKMTNPLKERIVYKIKCTSNEMFRIRPPVGALKAGETVTLALIFNQGKTVPENGKHYFAIYYVKAEDDKKQPRAAWTEHKENPDGLKKLLVDFKNEGGGEEKKDEKKEENKEDKKEDKKDEKKKDSEKKEDEDDDKK